MQISRITVFILEHASRAVAAVLPGDLAADKALSEYFRANPKVGAYERGVAAETAYAVIRNRRSLGAMAGEMPGARTPRSLALAALARFSGLNTRQFEAILKPSEMDLIARVKAAQADDLPAAVRLDLPDWLCERLIAEQGDAEATALALACKEPAPLDLRVNTLKATREEVLAQLHAAGLQAEPTPYSPNGLRLTTKPALTKNQLFIDGKIEVQDEGSQLLSILVGPKRGEMVADFCAGAGGKTLALGALMRSTGRLYAFDVSEGRLKKFSPRLKRSGLSNVHAVRIANENDLKIKRLAGKMDRVLVDAPCSGLGTLRRNPEIKWRQLPEHIDELAVKQSNILAGAARMVKPGGRLVYATCSVLKAENEAIAQAFLAAHDDFTLVRADALLKQAGIEISDAGGEFLVLRPQRHGTDGFFAAVMERKAAAKPAEKLAAKSAGDEAVVAETKAAKKAGKQAKAAREPKASAEPTE